MKEREREIQRKRREGKDRDGEKRGRERERERRERHASQRNSITVTYKLMKLSVVNPCVPASSNLELKITIGGQ